MKIYIYLFPLLFYSIISFEQNLESPHKTLSELEKISTEIQACSHLASSAPNEVSKMLLKIKEQYKK